MTVGIAMPGQTSLILGAEPLTGSLREIAPGLAAYTGYGVSHLCVGLTPNTAGAIEWLARLRELLLR